MMQDNHHINHRRSGRWVLILGVAGICLCAFLMWRAAVGVTPSLEMRRTGMNRMQMPLRLTGLFPTLEPAYRTVSFDALQPTGNSVSVVIDDFEDIPVGGFPDEWKAWRGDDEDARNLYSIQEENGNRYLQAHDDGTSIIIRKKMKEWNPREHRFLSWRWRARALPENGDERIGSLNDSAVAVYVVLDQNFFRIPKTLKYVWSTTLPVGMRHRRDGIGRPNVIVLQSGPKKLGQWVYVSVNVYDDFVRTFGREPPDHAVGIGVLTDGNATRSNAEGDYDDFVIHRYRDGS